MNYFKNDEYHNLPIDIDEKIDRQIDSILKTAGCELKVVFPKLFEGTIELNFTRNAGFYNIKTNETIEFKANQWHDEYGMTYDDLDNGWVRYGVETDCDGKIFAYISTTDKSFVKQTAKLLMKKFNDKFIEYYLIDILIGPNSQPLSFRLNSELKIEMKTLNESFMPMRRVGLMVNCGIMRPSNEGNIIWSAKEW